MTPLKVVCCDIFKGFSDSDATVEMVDIWNVPGAKQNGVCEAGTSGVVGDILVPKFMSTPKHPTKVLSAKHSRTSRKRLLLGMYSINRLLLDMHVYK